MKQINTSLITLTAGYPPSKKGLDFLQEEAKEVMAEIVQGQIGDTVVANQPYALYGCVKSGTTPFAYSAGAIYYNGEVYEFPAVASLAIATNDRCTITITPDPTADPTTMTDTNVVNMHDVRAIVVDDNATIAPATQFNFSDIIYIVNNRLLINDYAVDTPITATSYTSLKSGTLVRNKFKNGDKIVLEGFLISTSTTVETIYAKINFGGVAINEGSVDTSVYTLVNKHYYKVVITRVSATSIHCVQYISHLTSSTTDNLSTSLHDRAVITVPNMDTNDSLIDLQGKVSAGTASIVATSFTADYDRL